jgi:hypothetical protein
VIGFTYAHDAVHFQDHTTDSFDAPSKFDDLLLAVCVLVAAVRFIALVRLSEFGMKLFAIQEVFMSAAVNQMLFISFLCLGCFIVALVVLSRQHSLALAIMTYRGFMFGDGDGFTQLDMDGKGRSILLCFTAGGAFVFNIMVVNIMIAIYGNEYDRAEKDNSGLFLLGRTDYIVNNVLCQYNIPWAGLGTHRALTFTSVAIIIVSMYIGLHLQHHRSMMWVCAVMFAFGQILFSMALMQCEWFSPEGMDADGNERFLWICHARDWKSYWGDVRQEEEDAEKQLEEDIADKISAMMEEKFEKLLKRV